MRISDLLKLAFRNLFRRKARTALTVVGVAIGTISIVVMVSIGLGVNSIFDSEFMENGTMTIIQIQKYGGSFDESGNYVSQEQKLDDSTVQVLQGIDHVKAVSPIIEKYVELTSGKYHTGMSIRAMDLSAFEEFGFPELEYGEYPTAENPAVVVIGFQCMDQFYYSNGRNYTVKNVDPLTEKVTLQFQDGTVHSRKKPFKMELTNVAKIAECDNWEYSYYIYVEMNYFKEIWTKHANTLTVEDRKKAMNVLTDYDEIRINVDNIKNVETVMEEVKAMGYSAYSEMDYMQEIKNMSNTLQIILGAIGSIAMLVSAINIANTMVMSIYERTKEIGVMKVLGCLVRDVKRQFLIESGMLGLCGGIIGVGISFVLSYLLNTYGPEFLGDLFGASEGTKISVIPFWLPFLASGFGILVGVISGYFPARRATKIRAIEAMKSEG